jgi:uncharacterized protein
MTARLARINRHPIKSHGREDIASVSLLAGQGLPWDRHWAVAHDAARLVPGWNPCQNFARGAKAPGLMAIEARLDEGAGRITLTHPDLGKIEFAPDDPQDAARFLDWSRPLAPEGRAMPDRIVTAGRAMTDTDYASISVLNAASNAALAQRMGRDLAMTRWRGNLWLEGLAPWAEFDLIGRTLRIGDAELRIEERITRCRATMANPETGRIDGDTLAALQSGWGHQDFGVYAVVMTPGTIRVDDKVLIQ